MPRVALLTVLALAGSGCIAPLIRSIAGMEDPDAAHVRKAAAPKLACPVEEVTAVKDGEHGSYDWTATGCSNGVACKGSWSEWQCISLPLPWWFETEEKYSVLLVSSEVQRQTGCEGAADVTPPTAGAYAATLCDRDFSCRGVFDSVRRKLTMVGATCEEFSGSIERTSRKVAVDRLAVETSCPAKDIQIGEATAWIRGSERAYRLSACGKAYVCTTASGRTDCKGALAEEAPAPPQP